MCSQEERFITRDEKKTLIQALDNYVEARVNAVLKKKGIKEKCIICGKENDD